MALQLNGVTKYCNVYIPCDAATKETTVVVGAEANVGDTLKYQYILSNGGHCTIHYKSGAVETLVFDEPSSTDTLVIAGGSLPVNSTHHMFVFCPDVTVCRGTVINTFDVCCQVQSLDELIERLTAYAFDEEEMQAAINQYFEMNLNYTPIAIKSFTVAGSPVEKGRIISTASLAWSTNKVPMLIEINGVSYDSKQTSATLTGLTLTTNTTWTLKVTDDFNGTATMQTTLYFYNGLYYGAAAQPTSISSSFIRSLTKKLTNTRKGSVTVNAAGDQYIWIAFPVAFGEPTFKVGGFEGGFIDRGVIEYANAYGYVENYKVWQSENVNLGATTVVIE